MELKDFAVIVPLVIALGITIWHARTGDTRFLLLTLLLAVIWLRSNRGFEGPVLIRFTDNHGLVVADSVGLMAALAGLAVWARGRRRTAGDAPSLGPR